MSNVTLNAVGQDHVRVEFYQHGSSVTECTLNDELLDGQKSYQFCIDELSVPLKHAPIFSVKEATQLFRIRRRNAGTPYDYTNNLPLPGNDAAHSAPLQDSAFVATPDRPMYSVAELVRALQEFADTFNWQRTNEGILGVNHGFTANEDVQGIAAGVITAANILPLIKFDLTADGCIQFKGGDGFWSLFVVEFTAYGAATFGISLDRLHKLEFALLPDQYVLAQTANSFSTSPVNVLDEWVQLDPQMNTNNSLEGTFLTNDPLFSTADQRIKISVGSHLSTTSQVAVEDQVQTSDRNIAEAFFNNEATTEVSYENGEFNVAINSRVFAGQVAMIRKFDSHHMWNKLLTSYRVRFLRFLLYITYRVFDDATLKFKLEKRTLVIDPDEYWSFSVKFVSDI